MFEPLLCIILDGKLDDLEFDARCREVFMFGAFVQAFLGLGPAGRTPSLFLIACLPCFGI